jgi:hypothetical protein
MEIKSFSSTVYLIEFIIGYIRDKKRIRIESESNQNRD